MTATDQPTVQSTVDPAFVDFILLEAQLADEARYSEWENLWHDDALYWVPMRQGADPQTEVSYIYDNRPRIAKRVAQLNTGARHSQTPPSHLRRLVSNIEVVDRNETMTTVAANFALFEFRYTLVTWAGRYVYGIRTDGPTLQLGSKTVFLVNAEAAVPTLSFLI